MRQFLQYLPVLLFTAITLAQSFFGTPTGVTHVNTSRSNSTTPRIGPQVAIFRYGDLMSGPEPVDRYANMNVSPVTGVGGSNGGPYTVDIRMGTNKQHVAEFAGQRMYDLIHDALMKICPYERGRIGCYESMPGAGEPNDDLTMTYEYASEYWILDVPYYTDKGDYATNAYITITARAIFRNWKYPGLGAATYGLAAGIYARATENMENCYMESFNDETRVYQFCNVPDRVMIALPAEDGSVTESWLSMTIEFDGPTKYGQFDCEGTKKSVDGFWEAAVRPDMAKALGHPENEWNTCISCTDDENAFDVETWREHCVCLGGKCQTRG